MTATQLKRRWSFDDYHIGLLSKNGNTVGDHLAPRPPRMTREEWYKWAGDLCSKLNKGEFTLPGLEKESQTL